LTTVFASTLLMLFLIVAQIRTGDAGHEGVVEDGEYVGLEKMSNLTPEDRNAAWFHENTLIIRNDEAILDKVPVSIRHGEKTYSASDGGFLTYRARFTSKGGQSVVELRLFQSDYVAFRTDKHDQYTEIKTYPVTLVSDQIEFGGVRYKRSKVEAYKLDWLLPLLRIEPLEVSEPNLAIVVDSVVVSDYQELGKETDRLNLASCNGGYHYLEHPTTVEDFVGGKVKAIRVLRTAPLRPWGKPPTADEIRQRVRRVWEGKFQAAFCQLAWAEPTFWSIEATLEFEDGKRSPLITDGVHVALQNHDGKTSFFRLFPDAQ
jgi:hypothetical protein